MINAKAAIVIWFAFTLTACAGALTDAPPVYETRTSSQAATAPLPTARTIRTPTAISTLPFSSPTPAFGHLPTPSDKTITLANIDDLTLLSILQPGWPEIFIGPTDVELSPDGSRLAIGTPQGLYLLDTGDLSLLYSNEFTNGASRLAFSPDGQLLAIGSIGEILIFDLLSERSYATLSLEDWQSWQTVSGLAFSNGGKSLLQRGWRATAILGYRKPQGYGHL